MIQLLLDALAGYRLTRLVTRDTIVRPLRGRIIRWSYELRGDNFAEKPIPWHEWEEAVADDDDPPKLAELVTCRWCAGMWVAAGVVCARRLFPRAWQPIATALSISAASALVARLEEP